MKSLLIIGSVWPEPKSSAAGGRMMHLIKCFQELHWKICFASPASDSEFAVNLDDFNIQKERIVLNDDSFDVFIRDLNPNAVLFDRFMMEEQFGWRVAQNCPDALRILDTEDLHFLRQARQMAVKENREMTESDLKSETAKREIAAILRCDLSLIISTYEMTLLLDMFQINSALLHYLPLYASSLHIETNAFENRLDFVSIGNFYHAPNVDAIYFLKKEIWPHIRKALPNAKMHIYGAYPTPAMFQLQHVGSGFLVHGRTDDAYEVMLHARVCLAPLRFGAGLKGKLLDAMLCGTPSVTTSIGAEGMHGDLPWNGFVKDNPIEFASAAVHLYSTAETWNKSVENGNVILKNNFQSDIPSNQFMKRIDELMETLEEHRLANFFGSILMHHSLKSTLYMSRWIQEKNKQRIPNSTDIN